jgi:hypothetical protein
MTFTREEIELSQGVSDDRESPCGTTWAFNAMVILYIPCAMPWVVHYRLHSHNGAE